MDKILIAIDAGKHSCKAVAKNSFGSFEKVSFRNKLLETGKTMDVEVSGNSFAVSLDNDTYIIGDMGEERNLDITKSNIYSKLIAYTAISKLYKGNSIVQLALGCPVTIYKNKELRDDYKAYMLNDKYVEIIVNKAKHKFILDNILILPEGCGVVYLYPSIFKNNRIAVIDIGGLNMNFVVFDNLTPEIPSMFTLNFGSNNLETRLIDQLGTEFGVHLDTRSINQVIKAGGLKRDGEINVRSKEILDQVMRGHVQKIMGVIKERNYDLNLMDSVFIGGTSLLLSKYIKEQIKNTTIVEDAQWANVLGFYKIGEIRYEKAASNIG